MSYIVLKIYSFECDESGCGEVAEVGGEADLRASEKVLRKQEHWTRDTFGRHFCPKHSGAS